MANSKKGDKTGCSNYKGTSLLSITFKMLSNILLSRLAPYALEIIGDNQRGFRHTRSTTDHIFYIHHILEKNGHIMKQCNTNLQTSRKPMSQLGGRSCITFSSSLISP